MNRNLDGRVEVTCPHLIKKSKELIDNFDLGWKGNVKARVHSANLDNKYEKIMILYLELKLRPISIIKIKSNYWMKLFRNSSLFYLEYKWKCKTIIKNDQHKETQLSILGQMLCVY
jgi:hypothetical protein